MYYINVPHIMSLSACAWQGHWGWNVGQFEGSCSLQAAQFFISYPPPLASLNHSLIYVSCSRHLIMSLQGELVVFRESKMMDRSREGVPFKRFNICDHVDPVGLVETLSSSFVVLFYLSQPYSVGNISLPCTVSLYTCTTFFLTSNSYFNWYKLSSHSLLDRPNYLLINICSSNVIGQLLK